MADLNITSERDGDKLTLWLVGSAGIASADQMQMAVTRAIASRPAIVVVEISGLVDISSLFAGQLIALQTGLKHHGGRAVIAAPSPRVAEALDRMKIGLVIPIVARVNDAVM